MPRHQNPEYKRPARFDRPAFRPDLERVTYDTKPVTICHPWAIPIINSLSPAANKVFTLLVTLAMIGKRGYPGVAVCDDVAARTVRRITTQKCGISTWRKGRRELVEKGLASRTYWTRPDQHIKNGSRVVVVPGGQRVHIQGDQWCTKQIRITLLTPAGSGMFDKKTRLEKSDILPLLPTPVKSTARSQTEDRRKTPEGVFSSDLNQTTNKDVMSQPTSKSMLDCDPSTRQEADRDASTGKEGNSTCPPQPAAPIDPTIEQHRVEKIVDSGSVKAQNDQASTEPRKKSLDKGSGFPAKRGCSSDRPKMPKGKGERKGSVYAKTRLLNVLHQCLVNYAAAEADIIFSRCTTELELSAYSNWPSVINLPYWLSRAPQCTRRELFGYMRARIIPALRFSGPVTPREPKRYKVWTEKRRLSEKQAVPSSKLPSFLHQFSETVGL
jgi:hypothetical protein